MDFKEFVETHTIGEIKKTYPQIKDYLDNTGLWNLPDNLTFAKAFEDIDEEDLWQVGIRYYHYSSYGIYNGQTRIVYLYSHK